MPERTSYPAGTPSYVDLSTTDPEAARAFYGALFGWEYEIASGPQEGGYASAMKNQKMVAGIFQQQKEHADMGMPPAWNTYVTVDDVDATAGRVTSAGGQVLAPPFDVMDAGRMTVTMDPTGAALCFWQPKGGIGSELVNEHGTLTWNELVTPDVDTAVAYYGDLLGWGTEAMDMGDFTYTVWTLGGSHVGGAMPPPMEGIPPHWAVYFAVDDCDGTVETAKANGATALTEPMDSPPGRMCALVDPQGAAFHVIQLAEPPTE
ncbi:MAG: VOC family protein [Acidimicrobiia bacterium]